MFPLCVLPAFCDIRTTWITGHTLFKHPLMASAPLPPPNFVHLHLLPLPTHLATFHVCNPGKAKKLTLPIFQNFKKRRKPYVLPGSAPALSTVIFSHQKMHSWERVSFPPTQVSPENLRFIDTTNENEETHKMLILCQVTVIPYLFPDHL